MEVFLTISTDFERMLQHLIQQRSDLTIDKLRSLIDAKKQKIGAGYLTEQGALFLVAARPRHLIGSAKIPFTYW